MTGVNVKAQRRPIFDKAEDLDKAYKQQTKICARGQGQNARQCTKPSITYDHAKKAVMKHTCDNFKLAYTELHYNAERM